MFPKRYFGNRMFAPRFWAKVGAGAPAAPTGGEIYPIWYRRRGRRP